MIGQNWSPGVVYIIFAYLMGLFCVCQSENIDIGSKMSFVYCVLFLNFFSILMLSVVRCDSESTGDYLTTDKG